MIVEFLNSKNKFGVSPELVRVDGHYAIRLDDVVYALNGEEISEFGNLEVVTEFSDPASADTNVALQLFREGDVESLVLVFYDPSKAPEGYAYYDYFGPYCHESDAFLESMKFVELDYRGWELTKGSGLNFKGSKEQRERISSSNMDFLAAWHLSNRLVFEENAKLVHCGIQPAWDSIVVFANVLETENGLKCRVRTYNAELVAFSSYQDETSLITQSGYFIPMLLRKFTHEELRSGGKVVREYLRKSSSPFQQSFVISDTVGIKLRPSKVYECDALLDGNGDSITDLTNGQLLDALGLQGKERMLISCIERMNELTLVWRDRESSNKYWTIRSSASEPSFSWASA